MHFKVQMYIFDKLFHSQKLKQIRIIYCTERAIIVSMTYVSSQMGFKLMFKEPGSPQARMPGWQTCDPASSVNTAQESDRRHPVEKQVRNDQRSSCCDIPRFLCSIYHGIYLSIKGKEFTSQEMICDSFSTTASFGKAAVTQRSRPQKTFERRQHSDYRCKPVCVEPPNFDAVIATACSNQDWRWQKVQGSNPENQLSRIRRQ